MHRVSGGKRSPAIARDLGRKIFYRFKLHPRHQRRLALTLLALIAIIGVEAVIKIARAQVITSFSVRYTVNAKGDIAAIGNTLLTCTLCLGAEAGTGVLGNNNNSFNMAFVDVDSDATTFNSSTATLSLPAGAIPLFAGLYWGADTSAGTLGSAAPTAASRAQVRFRTPTAASYTTLNGTQIGISGTRYVAFFDVTALVQSAGNGVYTVANVQAGRGQDRYAGWSLVIAYSDPAEPPRNLTILNGYANVSSGNPNVAVPVSGFLTPPAGTVNTRLGTVAFEGDLDADGDALRLNATTISNALNPANNYFNSSITRLGTRISAKNPDNINNFGFDIDISNASGILANNATSATINLTTGGETYFPAVVTFATELYAPNLQAVKSGTNITRTGDTLPGDILEYTIVLTNSGQDSASNVILTDPIPANSTYVPGTLSITAGANAGAKSDTAGNDQAEFDSANNRVIFRLGTGAGSSAGGTIAPAATTTVRFRVQINAGVAAATVISNQASVTATAVQLNQSLTQTSNVVSFTVSSADLSLTKTVNNPTPNVGTNVTFTITLINGGTSAATNVSVRDQLPAGLSFVGSTPSQGTYSSGTGIWAVGTIPANSSRTLLITATVTQAGAISNTAQVSASDYPDPDSTPNNNNAGEDDQATATLTGQQADLALSKVASNPTPSQGDSQTYTITLTNSGPSTATGIRVRDNVPANTTFVSSSATVGSYSNVTGEWNVGTLASGASAILQITVTVDIQVGMITNTAQVIASDQPDPDSTPNNNNANEDDQATVTTPQAVADLSLTKTVNNPMPNVGSNVIFTITVSNAGPQNATNVAVSDPLPAGLSFVSASTASGSYNSVNGIWTIGTINNGANAALQITAQVSASGTFTNTAQVSASTQFDQDSSPNNNVAGEDDQASVSVSTQQADLSLTKTAGSPGAQIGDNVTFTLTVNNAGPDAATGVTVQDQLPAGLSFVSASAGCANSSGLVTCNAASIAANGSAVFTITAQVTTNGTFTNQAQITASQVADPDSTPNNGFANGEDDAASFTITALQANLAINKTNHATSLMFRQTVTYTITVTNSGPDSVTNITVIDQAPIELSGVNWSCVATVGSSCSASNGVGNINTPINIASGGTVTFTLSGILDGRASGNLVNTASLQLPVGVTDPDLSNNSSTDTDAVDQGTAVEFAGGTASRIPGGALIEWVTGFEAHNLGFHIYRSRNGERTRITDQLIAGSALLAGPQIRLSSGYSYAWIDRTPNLGGSVEYWLQDLDLNGQITWHGPIILASSAATTLSGGPEAKRSATLADLNAVRQARQTGDDRETLVAPLPAGDAAASLTSATASGPSLAAQTAVKIGVRKEGWYRVTGASLLAAGLPANSDPRNWQLYVDGQPIACRVNGEENGQFDPDDAVEFYGLGLDTPSTDLRIYWLIVGTGPGLRIESVQLAGGAASGPSFPSTVERRDRFTYFSALLNGEAENFFGSIFDSTPTNQRLTLRQVDLGYSGEAKLEVRVQGALAGAHLINVSINGQPLAPFSFEGRTHFVTELSVPHSALVEGENIVTLRGSGGNDVNFVDRIRLTYRRLYQADGDRLILRAPANTRISIADFSAPQIHVFDVTEPGAVRELRGEIRTQNGRYLIEVTVGGVGERRLLALTDPQAEAAASIRANPPYTLAPPTADLVVISHGDLISGLQPLVDARRQQGLQVQVIDVDDIYDDLSFGHKSPAAIRQYLGSVTGSGRSLLLVGDASADPRNYFGWGEVDLVPTRLFDSSQLETATDDWFADFNNDGIAEMSVGRLPARTLAEATRMIAKIVGYDQRTPNNNVVLAADIGDTFNFEGAANQLASLIGGGASVQKIYRGQLGDAEARRQLLESLQSGPKLINYVGHGSINLWRGNLLTGADAGQLLDPTQTSMLVSMTCFNGFFHDPAVASLAENLIKAQGGAVAAWASSSITGPTAQAGMNQALIRELFNGSAMTVGEATRRAKAAIPDQDVRRSWILFGDPTTRLR